MKTIEIMEQRELEPNTFCYEILRPSGNDTAVVFVKDVRALQKNAQLRRKINQAIKQANPNVEQVGFLDLSNSDQPTVMMAGLEFCGNFLRSCAYLIYLTNRKRNQDIFIQFILQTEELIIRAGVNGFQNAWAEVPAPDKSQLSLNDKYTIVELKGITQIVVPYSDALEKTADNMIDRALNFLRQNSLEYLHRSLQCVGSYVY